MRDAGLINLAVVSVLEFFDRPGREIGGQCGATQKADVRIHLVIGVGSDWSMLAKAIWKLVHEHCASVVTLVINLTQLLCNEIAESRALSKMAPEVAFIVTFRVFRTGGGQSVARRLASRDTDQRRPMLGKA